MKLTQEESFGVWDEHFKTILLLLLETLGDKEVKPKMDKEKLYISFICLDDEITAIIIIKFITCLYF